MHLKLTTLLFAMCAATGVVAQEAEEGTEGPGYELEQFSDVLNPAEFNLAEKVQWGTRLVFMPAYFETKVPLFIYDPNDGFDCNSGAGRAFLDTGYGITKLQVRSDGTNSAEPNSEPDIVIESWTSRQEYCNYSFGNGDVNPLEPDIPAVILEQIRNSLREGESEALISVGPIAGGEPVAKLWAECDERRRRWMGSPCADRLGPSLSGSNSPDM